MQDVASTVYAGVDTHKDKHVLCLLDGLGRKTFVGEFPADAAGYDALAEAIGGPARCAVVGVEGTASFGAGLTARLQGLGYDVVEVLRPKRDKRRRGTDKNDAVDAELAARRAAAGDGTSVPKSRDGWAEAARALSRAREIAVRITTEASNAAKSLVNTAPEPIRAKYSGMGTKGMMRSLSRKRKAAGDVVADALMSSLRAIARTWREQDARASELEGQIAELVRANAPALLEVDGCGPLAAAELAIAAGDNPGRMRSEAAFASLCGACPVEASSGKVVRHRLNRGGNRRANHALHVIVLSRMRHDERTKAYVEKRTRDGKSKREIIRCLKRYVAREVYRALLNPLGSTHAPGGRLRESRLVMGMTQREVAERLDSESIRISEIEREARKHFELRDRYESLLRELDPNADLTLDTRKERLFRRYLV